MIGFGKNERRAAAALVVVVGFFVGSVYKIGKKNLWFEPKNHYKTLSSNVVDLNEGSPIMISGLRVGELTRMRVNDDNTIDIEFSVAQIFAGRLREDAKVMFARDSIFGDKHIDLIPGSKKFPTLANGSFIQGKETTSLSDFITGNKLNSLMTDVEEVVKAAKKISVASQNIFDGIASKKGELPDMSAVSLIQPAMENFVSLSNDLMELTEEIKKTKTDLPHLVAGGKKMVEGINEDFLDSGVAQRAITSIDRIAGPIAEKQLVIEQLMTNIQSLSATLTKNPDYGDRVLHTLSELTVTLKALQRTWILSDHSNDVRDDNKNNGSQPAH